MGFSVPSERKVTGEAYTGSALTARELLNRLEQTMEDSYFDFVEDSRGVDSYHKSIFKVTLTVEEV